MISSCVTSHYCESTEFFTFSQQFDVDNRVIAITNTQPTGVSIACFCYDAADCVPARSPEF